MRIAYFGTPPPAVEYLAALHESRHEVVAVVTQPDRPAGRGRKLHPSPVREAAESFGYKVMTPEAASDPDFIADLRECQPELGVVVAFGQILRPRLLELPAEGFVNVHYSLLPEFRGAAPVYGALLEGRGTTGVTVQRMVERLDAGDIILQQEIEIAEDDNRGTLTDRLTEVGVGVLRRALDLIERGEAQPVAQDESKASYVGRVETDDCHIDWTLPGQDIKRLIRACTPWPGAWCLLGRDRLKVQDVRVSETVLKEEGVPGEIVEIRGIDGLFVLSGDGAVEILRLQPPGRKPMTGAEFVRGARLSAGDRLS